MDERSKQFLFDLLLSASPSGFEEPAARIWRAEAETFADEVSVDSNGNSVARLRGSGPKVIVEGHIDEIGLMISYVDDDGFVWFNPIGGWDDQILTGQRVRILGSNGSVPGVVGRRPAHLLSSEDRGKASKIKELWIDIGAASGTEARGRVMIGDPIVIDRGTLAIARQQRRGHARNAGEENLVDGLFQHI